MALLEPADVVDDGGGSGFDASVIATDRGIAADRGVGEAAGLLLGGKQFDVPTQRTLVAFQGQDIVAPASAICIRMVPRFGNRTSKPAWCRCASAVPGDFQVPHG